MSNWPNTVTIGSFVCDQDEPGDFRVTTLIEGWGSPARRLTTEALTGRHGSMISGRLWAERTIIHSGFVECATAVAANGLANDLAGLAPGVAHDYVVAHEALAPLGCSVNVAVGANPDWIDDKSFTYVLTLLAPDPFKRSLTATTTPLAAGSSVAVAHPGTAAADLRVTLTSAGTVVLSAGGVTLRVKSAPSGTVIDTGSTSIVDSTGASLGHLLDGPPMMPALPAGGGTVQQAGTANLSIEHFDTYA